MSLKTIFVSWYGPCFIKRHEEILRETLEIGLNCSSSFWYIFNGSQLLAGSSNSTNYGVCNSEGEDLPILLSIKSQRST